MAYVVERTPSRVVTEPLVLHDPAAAGWVTVAAPAEEIERERFLVHAQQQLRQLEEEELAIKHRLRQLEPRKGAELQQFDFSVEAPFTKYLDELVYPEPSEEWQREVASLQDKIAVLQQKEAALVHVDGSGGGSEHYNREWNRLTDVLQEASNSLHANQVEETKQLLDKHARARTEELEDLVRIANERCNTLNRLFEIKLGQTQRATSPPPPPGGPPQPDRRLALRVKQLEAQVEQLRAENESLRLEMADTAGSRAREEELRRLVLDQSRELELRMHPPADDDFSHIGVLVANATVPGGLRMESQSGVRVTKVASPAAEAGVRVGDVITWSTTSTRVTDIQDLALGVGKARLGDNVTLLVRRGGQEKRVDLEVGRRRPI